MIFTAPMESSASLPGVHASISIGGSYTFVQLPVFTLPEQSSTSPPSVRSKYMQSFMLPRAMRGRRESISKKQSVRGLREVHRQT